MTTGRPNLRFLMPALVGLSTATPSLVCGQEYSPAPTIRWVATTAVPANTIIGIVVDAESAKPVESAQVRIKGTQIGALTDSTGRFQIDILRLDVANPVLVAEFIGYRAVEQPVQFVEGAGLAVHASMEKARRVHCALTVCGYPGGEGSCPGGVRVVINSLIEWLPENTPVTLVARSGALADTTVARVERSPVYMAAGESLGIDGPFEATIAVPGYADWQASGIWLYSRDCFATKASRWIHAWLLPAGFEEPLSNKR